MCWSASTQDKFPFLSGTVALTMVLSETFFRTLSSFGVLTIAIIASKSGLFDIHTEAQPRFIDHVEKENMSVLFFGSISLAELLGQIQLLALSRVPNTTRRSRHIAACSYGGGLVVDRLQHFEIDLR